MKTLQKNRKSLFGFTLVELIVVITILAILWTIAFVSFGWQSSSARDSNRIADMTGLSKSLEIFSVKSGFYPDPSSPFLITYSGATIWKQGTAGDSVIQTAWAGWAKISKKPVDPLNNSEYTYSKASETREYALKADYEGNSLSYNERTYASDSNPQIVYIKSNYNGVVAKSTSGSTINLIAVPSLITSSSTGANLSIDLVASLSGKILFHGQTNSGWINFVPKLAYSSGSLPSNFSERVLFASGVANAYSGTSISNNASIAPFVTALASATTNSWNLASLGGNFISASLGGSAGVSSSSNNTPTATWNVVSGGDCAAVDNSLGIDGSGSTCSDNRIYTHSGAGATHSKIYTLLKISGKWWFNQNLAYPPATGYQGSNTWSGTDVGYYSCPGNNGTTTADCSLVSTLGYLYQWSAATLTASNTVDITTIQWICPSGWHIPKKSDFSTASNAYWPDPANDNSWQWSTSGWSRSYIGYRTTVAIGTFYTRGTVEYLWSSFESSSSAAWVEYFNSSTPTQSFRNTNPKALGFAVRCLKN